MNFLLKKTHRLSQQPDSYISKAIPGVIMSYLEFANLCTCLRFFNIQLKQPKSAVLKYPHLLCYTLMLLPFFFFF